MVLYSSYQNGHFSYGGNWYEDNSIYLNRCIECNGYFYGHKGRVICKKCHNITLFGKIKRFLKRIFK